MMLLDLFSNEGIPAILQSDNGGEFVSTIIRNLMPKLGIKLINGSPYSPTTQGQVERFNRTLKFLLRKEIQIEISNNNFTVVEDWANILIERVIDSYRHKVHRSLARTPWELYKNRTSPHPIKSITPLETISSAEIEECCSFPNLGLDSCNSSVHVITKEAIRKHLDVRERFNISTLTQTRKVQMENYRKFRKNDDKLNFKLGTIAFMKNPLISRFRKKKNFLETTNIKVKILRQHFASDQYQVEYINSKGVLKQTWVHQTELFVANTINPGNTDNYAGETNTIKLTIQDYIKLLTNFEQHIAEKWCNSRKMKYKLVGEIQEDDKDHFSELDSRQSREGIFNSLQYYGKLLFEILDSLFCQFCTHSFSMEYDHDSSKIEYVLRYLANKGFTEHLGFIQHWYRSRKSDDEGKNFRKIQELRNPSTRHQCEQCIFTEICTHDCCLKLLSYTYHQKVKAVNYDDNNNKPSILCKRSRDISPTNIFDNEDDYVLSDEQECHIEEAQLPLDNDDESIYKQASLKSTDKLENSRGKRLKIESYGGELYFQGEDLFKPITFRWRQRINQEILCLKIKLEDPTEFSKTTYLKLNNCIPKKKVSIIPDGNCLYRAISWWLTCVEDSHGLIRTKLVEFMKTSSPCEKYVKNKTNQTIQEYVTQNNTMMSTVWGSDVELFSIAIWLQTDVFVYINGSWNKYSFKGFNPKKGRNISSNQAIYLGNEAAHYEPIITVIRKYVS